MALNERPEPARWPSRVRDSVRARVDRIASGATKTASVSV